MGLYIFLKKVCKGKKIQLLGTLKPMCLGEIRKIKKKRKNVLNKVENNKKSKVIKYLNT